MKKYLSLGGAIALGSFIGLTEARKPKGDDEIAWHCVEYPHDPICPTYANYAKVLKPAEHIKKEVQSELTSCDEGVEPGTITGMVRARHIDRSAYSLDVREDEFEDEMAEMEEDDSLDVEHYGQYSLSPAVQRHYDSPYSGHEYNQPTKVKHTFADCPENCGETNWNDGRDGFHCWDWADDMCKQCVLRDNRY